MSERFPDFEITKVSRYGNYFRVTFFYYILNLLFIEYRAESILNIAFSKRSFLHQYDKSLNDFNLFFYLTYNILNPFSVVWTTIMNLETFSISDSETFKLIMLICLLRIYLIFCSIDKVIFWINRNSECFIFHNINLIWFQKQKLLLESLGIHYFLSLP
jgi:hypothetical protein